MPAHDYTEKYQWQLMPETVIINGRTMKIYRSCVMAPYDEGYLATNGHAAEGDLNHKFDPNSNMYIIFAVSVEQELQKLTGVTASASTIAGTNTLRVRLMLIPLPVGLLSDGSFPQWLKIDLGKVCSVGGYKLIGIQSNPIL